MAVYTEVSEEELTTFIADYDIGKLLSYKGITEGVENSNYLIITGSGKFILTLYEKRVLAHDLPFFLGLMEHFSKCGLPCPLPIRGQDGRTLRSLCGRSAAIINFLPGKWLKWPGIDKCAKVGAVLASFHNAGSNFLVSRPNDLSVSSWRPLLESSRKKVNEVYPGLLEQLSEKLMVLEHSWPVGLPSGIIHADLFPDNVFFQNGQVSGVIDFYFACTDAFAYDLAICLNAWCFEPDLSFNIKKARVLLEAYQKEKALSEQEIHALPMLARGAAMRFLLTRLYDWLNTPVGAFVTRKDPMEFHTKLRFHETIADIGAYGLD
ncbi:MAG: homoserine kinase [Magnetovibrio sp.]|nr:homoserine kinase [Magnetovibrio sp.]|tara:strand:+ start:1265 stop:2227 length:963 start_codon:yes stop_codon:yes gene_type:complete